MSKIYMELKTGENLELTSDEAFSILGVLETANFITVDRLGRTIQKYQIIGIKEIQPITCTRCGIECYEGDHHACNYIPFETQVLNSNPQTESNLAKLKHQIQLSKHMPARQAYETAWGEPLTDTGRTRFESHMVSLGCATLKNGVFAVIEDKMNEYRKREYAISKRLESYDNQI